MKKFPIDTFVLLIVAMVVLASIFPVEGRAAQVLSMVSKAGIAFLFFLHGAKLSRQAIVQGISNWKMHLLIVGLTFVLFPLLGLGLSWLPAWAIKPQIAMGFLYLCSLPSTVNSSVIFTSTARGNVAGAVCAASISSLLGVFVSPFLVGMLMQQSHDAPIDFFKSVQDIFIQLMLPFFVGHLSRKWVIGWIQKNSKIVKITDQSAILLIVYLAFSEAVNGGIWTRIGFSDFLTIFIVSGAILAFVMGASVLVSRGLGFSKEDEITTLFCGSKKSLVNGIPMANIIFPANLVGIMVIPLMIFHQIQLIVCAILAQKYAQRGA